MKVMLESAREIMPHIWTAQASPHDLSRLGAVRRSKGPRSVLMVDDATLAAGQVLIFDAASAELINVGTTSTVVVIGCDAAGTHIEPQVGAGVGPGDREFLRLVEQELMGDAKEAAQRLLDEVRTKFSGDLKRGERNNFSETPDNFWYVIVQPRNQSLSITVRGAPERFESISRLAIKADRPGYTRFQVRNLAEVQSAIKIIEASRRK